MHVAEGLWPSSECLCMCVTPLTRLLRDSHLSITTGICLQRSPVSLWFVHGLIRFPKWKITLTPCVPLACVEWLCCRGRQMGSGSGCCVSLWNCIWTVLKPMGLGLQVQLGSWWCFFESSLPSHALSFTHVDGGGDGEGNFTIPFYLWRSTMFDISMPCAAFGHCLETDFLISKKGKSLMMVVAGSLPPWVMQPGKNRKKIILPPENITKCLISTVGYVIAEGKIFLLPGGYPSHCPILSLPGRPSMQRCISSPVCPDGSRPNSAPSIKTQLLPDVTNTQPSRPQDIPAGGASQKHHSAAPRPPNC